MSGRIDVNAWFVLHGHTVNAARRFERALAKAPPAQSGTQAANDLLQLHHPKPPQLDDAALIGFAGEVVERLTKDSEAHPAGVLASFLAAVGNAAGPRAHIPISADRHPARLNVVLIGDTGVGRKGLAGNLVYDVMAGADPNWYQDHVIGGLQSGEALIEAAEATLEDEKRSGQLLIKAAEFSQVLKVSSRQNMTLSEVIREAFDGGTLALRRSSKPTVVVTGAHISIVAHITPEELRSQLDDISMANGFANRFLFIHVERPQLVPRPKEPDFSDLSEDLAAILGHARRRGVVRWSKHADAWWRRMYPKISVARQGLVGALTARAEAKLLRVAVAYLLLEPDTKVLMVHHLEAAHAVLRYSEQSARNVFGDRTGDPLGDRILGILRGAFPCVVAQGELGEALGGNISGERVEREVTRLINMQQADRWQVSTGGRPRVDIQALPWR